MDWAWYGSGAPGYDLSLRLKDTFGYTNAVPAWYINGYYEYSLEEVKKVVIPNCDARIPMLMSVSGADGHAVLVDGYGYSAGDFCMHVNLGWGGSGDAWYIPPYIEDFTIINGFVFNIFTNKTGSILSGRVLDASGAPIANASVVLTQGTSTDDVTTTDSNGIYAFIAQAGTYLVTASYASQSETIHASVSETVGTRLTGDGRYYYSTAVIGNSYTNDISITGVAGVSSPVFSPESCLFYPSTNVTITCSTAGATIRYTLDGTTPTETSTVYTGQILVVDTTTIKARAFATGSNPSATASATYTYNAAAGAPKGDYFDNPINISGESGTRVIDDNADYTIEDGEPYHTLENNSWWNQYRSAWYKWTAPGSGTMTFSTKCSGGGYIYPTYIAIYTGDALSSITRRTYSTSRDSNYVTSLTFAVEQGVTYRIVGVMGYDGSGKFTLEWSGDLIVEKSPASWLAEKGLGGVTETTDGVPNLFRYVFDKPSGSFSTISSVGFGSSGVTLTLPTIVNLEGVTLTVLSTTDITDWTSTTVERRTITITSGNTVNFEINDPSRFYRLNVDLSE